MKIFIYVGLGNPGSRFDGTRHNLGIAVLRAWLETIQGGGEFRVGEWKEESLYYHLQTTNYKLHIDCLFPTTMMNDSGQAVASYLGKKSVPLSHVVVIHDDVELPLGEVRLVAGGSAKGHNGVRSIQEHLGASDFKRLRLGVGRPLQGVDLSTFVLTKFSSEEQETVQKMITEAVKILSYPTTLMVSP